MADVTKAKVPKSNLATNTKTIIATPNELADRLVTSEESDSDDSAVRVAPSLHSDSEEDTSSDEEIQAVIHGQSVNNSINQSVDDRIDQLVQQKAKETSIKSFLCLDLTVPALHDYSAALAECELENQAITTRNEEVVVQGWTQMLKEIKNNLKMCQMFWVNYRGRLELTAQQILTWTSAKKSNFRKFPVMQTALSELESELRNLQIHAKSDNKSERKEKMRGRPILGQVWKPIPKPGSLKGLRATRDEWANYLVNRLTRLMSEDPKASKLMKLASPWIRIGLRNQAVFEDSQQTFRSNKMIGARSLTGKISIRPNYTYYQTDLGAVNPESFTRNCSLRHMRQRIPSSPHYTAVRANRAQFYRQQRMQRLRMQQRRRQANRAKRQCLM